MREQEMEKKSQTHRVGERSRERWREQVFSLSTCHFTDPHYERQKHRGEITKKKEDVHYQTTLFPSLHFTLFLVITSLSVSFFLIQSRQMLKVKCNQTSKKCLILLKVNVCKYTSIHINIWKYNTLNQESSMFVDQGPLSWWRDAAGTPYYIYWIQLCSTGPTKISKVAYSAKHEKVNSWCSTTNVRHLLAISPELSEMESLVEYLVW